LAKNAEAPVQCSKDETTDGAEAAKLGPTGERRAATRFSPVWDT